MPRKNMPTATSTINTSHTKTSYVAISRRRVDFPAAPNLGIVPAVADLNNSTLTFTATLVTNSTKRAVVKLVAVNPPGGAVTPADGTLSITLLDMTDPANPVTLPVTETPVDYIDDPGAP